MERIQQRIYLSRKSRNSIEFEHEVLRIPLKLGGETSFEILIINHGEPTHVHFSLGEDMADKVMILQDKVYVIEKEKIAAIVRLPKSYADALEEEEMGAGDIFVSSGYGATKRSFSVEIVEQETEERTVPIEERIDEVEAKREIEEKKEEVVREIAISLERLAFLRRLAVSAAAIALFLIAFALSSYTNQPINFTFALIAAAIFLFIVIYNQ